MSASALKPELNKTALLGAGLQILTEKIPGLNEKTGGLLEKQTAG